jgi:hypothetical protein
MDGPRKFANPSWLSGLRYSGAITLKPSGDLDDYFTFATISDIPTIYGTGAYLRIGDAYTTTCGLNAEDDLFVTGDFEATYGFIGPDNTGITANAITDVLQIRCGAGTNNEAAGQGVGVGFYIGNDASELEKRGSIQCQLSTATNGSEDSKLLFGNMVGGSLINNMVLSNTELLLGTSNNATFAKLTLRNNQTATAGNLIYDSMLIELRGSYWDGAAAQLRANTIQTIMEDNDPIIFYLKFAGNSGTFMRLRDNAGAMTIHADQPLQLGSSSDLTATTDEVRLGSFDIAAGHRSLCIASEEVVAAETDETKFSHKYPVRINGATYYIMLTQS